MTTRPDLIAGEFVKISVDRTVHRCGDPQPIVIHTMWFFARWIAWVDHQAVVEDPTGERMLVDATQVHVLDIVVTVDRSGS